MDYKIVAVCGANTVSGGVEAIHQFVDALNSVQENCAAVCYIPWDQEHSVPAAYGRYKVPTVKKMNIPSDALVVLPETLPGLHAEFSQKIALWWLSVDNFDLRNLNTLEHYDLHLCQSYYSIEFLREHGYDRLDVDNIIELSDYINDDYFNYDNLDKHNVVAVNPAKGKELIEIFIEQNPDLKIINLSNMTRQEVINSLKKCKVYIDFGHHPGKDRIPREARLLNCVVFVNRKGAAVNTVDISLGDYYKFDDFTNLRSMIEDVFENYDDHLQNQEDYKDLILEEKENFFSQAKNVLFYDN